MNIFVSLVYAMALLVIVASYSFAQAKTPILDSFWGIKFGSTKLDAKKMILGKKTGKIDIENSSGIDLVFRNAEFAGRNSEVVKLKFLNDKFLFANVTFMSDSDDKVIELYERLQKDLNEKYFTSNFVSRSFEKPYFDGDGNEALALKLGKAQISTIWMFEQAPQVRNFITLNIDENLMVVLSYVHLGTKKIEDEKVKKKIAKDL